MRFAKLISKRVFLLVLLCLALAGLSGCVSSAVNAGVAVVKAPFEFGRREATSGSRSGNG